MAGVARLGTVVGIEKRPSEKVYLSRADTCSWRVVLGAGFAEMTEA